MLHPSSSTLDGITSEYVTERSELVYGCDSVYWTWLYYMTCCIYRTPPERCSAMLGNVYDVSVCTPMTCVIYAHHVHVHHLHLLVLIDACNHYHIHDVRHVTVMLSYYTCGRSDGVGYTSTRPYHVLLRSYIVTYSFT